MWGNSPRKPTVVDLQAPRIVMDRSPLTRFLIILLVLIVLAVVAVLAYDFGRQNAGFDSAEASREYAGLQDEVERLREKEARHQLMIARLERSSQIDKQAANLVKDQIGQAQDELLALKQELAFYRSIVSPANANKSVQIHSLKLRPEEGQERLYRFKVTLLQTLSKKAVQGTVAVSVEGANEGELLTLSQKELGMKSKVHKLSFKAFQVVEDRMVLPEGFTPQRVLVKVIRKAKKTETIEKSFDWPL